MVPTVQTGSLAKGLLEFTKVFAGCKLASTKVVIIFVGIEYRMLYQLLANYLIVGLGPSGLDIWDSLMKDMVP